jgi:hypothetical protein
MIGALWDGGGIFDRVYAERERQWQKWGDQRHPDGTGEQSFAWLRDFYRKACQSAAKDDAVTWRHILREEVYEALAEDDPVARRAELIQVAAMAFCEIEQLDAEIAFTTFEKALTAGLDE